MAGDRALDRLVALAEAGDRRAALELVGAARRTQESAALVAAHLALRDWPAVAHAVARAWLDAPRVPGSDDESWPLDAATRARILERAHARSGLSLDDAARSAVIGLATRHRDAMAFPVSREALGGALLATALAARWAEPIAGPAHAFGSLPIGHAVRERVFTLAVREAHDALALVVGLADGEAHQAGEVWPAIVAPGDGACPAEALFAWAEESAADRIQLACSVPGA